jgi:hypothetical protein
VSDSLTAVRPAWPFAKIALFLLFYNFAMAVSASKGLVPGYVVPSSAILVTLMMRSYVPLKCRFLQGPHGITSQKMAFFIVIAVKTSNLI